VCWNSFTAALNHIEKPEEASSLKQNNENTFEQTEWLGNHFERAGVV
jgi:hypothetical protein